MASMFDMNVFHAGLSTVVSSAYAGDSSDSSGSGGKQGAMGDNRGGQGKKGAGSEGHRGGKSMSDLLADDDDDSDSDRPDWAGVPGGEGRPGGGGNPSPGDTKGDIYGDMILLLRDPVTGLPILTADGWTQACTDVACTPELAVEMVDGEVPSGVTTLEVDLGRASVARSPDSVIDHALDEALSKLTVDGAVLGTDAAGRITITVNGVVTTIDSPLENLALYVDLMEGLASDATSRAEAALGSLATLDTAASLLAGVADKTGDISLDYVVNENVIVGLVDTGEVYDFSGFTYDRDFDNVTYFYTLDGGTTVQSATLDVDVYLQAINGDVPSVGEFAALFATAADDALEVIELTHTQIHYEVLPGTQ